MNILMLHPHDIYSSAEPWTIRIKSLAEEFAGRGHRIILVYFPVDIGKDCRDISDESGLKIVALNRSSHPLTFFKNVIKILQLAETADIIHFQKCHHYAALPAVIAAYIKGKPLHYDWDDWETKIWFESNHWIFRSRRGYLHTQWMGFFFKTLERFLPKLADTISVSSQRLKNLCLSLGIDKKKICIAPVGADLKKFKPELDNNYLRIKHKLGKRKVALYLGQLHGGQYVELFIKAANMVLHRYPEIIFIIVGEGFKGKMLRELTGNLGIENEVIFTGSVPHDEIPNYISLSDVCVACFEDNDVTCCKSPLKIAEYLASGKAIIASNVGEVRNMAGGVGLLVKPGSYKAIADGVLKVLNDDTLKQEMEKRARRRAEAKYNWIVTADSILNAYNQGLPAFSADPK